MAEKVAKKRRYHRKHRAKRSLRGRKGSSMMTYGKAVAAMVGGKLVSAKMGSTSIGSSLGIDMLNGIVTLVLGYVLKSKLAVGGGVKILADEMSNKFLPAWSQGDVTVPKFGEMSWAEKVDQNVLGGYESPEMSRQLSAYVDSSAGVRNLGGPEYDTDEEVDKMRY